MKKVLFATTAIVAAGAFASSANAADPLSLSVGGSMQQWVGWMDQEKDGTRTYNNVGISTDTQVAFSAETTLDNGWTVSAAIEMDHSNNNVAGVVTTGQEYVDVNTQTFGTIRAGRSDELTDSTHNGNLDVGMGMGDVDLWSNTPVAGWTAGNGIQSTTINDAISTNDNAMVGYTSPQLAGLITVTASHFTGAQQHQTNVGSDTVAEGTTANIALNTDISGISVGADVGWGWDSGTGGSTGTAAQSIWNAGLNVGFGAAQFQAGFLNVEADTFAGNTADTSRDVWEASARYDINQWNLSLTYQNEQYDPTTAANDEEETQTWMASARYTLGNGVQWRTSVFSVDYSDSTGVDNNNTSAVGVVTGLNLSF